MMRMKKLLFCLLAVLCLCASLMVPALAEESYVFDEAGLLSASERGALESQAAGISEEYGCAVYVVTVRDYREYGSGDVRAVAESLFTENGFGLGADGSGVMLLMSMEDRDYALIAHGYGNVAFTDYGKDRLSDEFLDNFRRDDWYGGFADYVSYAGEMLELSRGGEPLDVNSPGADGHSRSFFGGLRERLGVFGVIVVIVAVPALIALIVCTVAKRNMKNVKKAEKADFFAVPGSMKLTVSEDRFTHVTQTRVKVESDDDHGGGKGGTHINSSGFSGKSGKF